MDLFKLQKDTAEFVRYTVRSLYGKGTEFVAVVDGLPEPWPRERLTEAARDGIEVLSLADPAHEERLSELFLSLGMDALDSIKVELETGTFGIPRGAA